MAKHETLLKDVPMGCTRAVCSCGWESAGTNRPQHLSRAIRAHKQAANLAAMKGTK